MRQQHYKKSEVSERALLSAAHSLFVEKGFEKTSIKEIVAASGLSVGSFYHHFKSKDDLLSEAFLEFDDQLTDDVIARYDRLDALAAIKAILLDKTKYSEAIGPRLMSEYYRVHLQHERMGSISPLRTSYQAVKNYVEKAQSLGLLGPEYTSSSIATYLTKCVRGTVMDWCLHDGSYKLTRKVAAEFDLYLLPFLNHASE